MPPGRSYVRCDGCGHRWRAPGGHVADAGYYHALLARNDTSSAWFRRKLDESVGALQSLGIDGKRLLEVGCAEGGLGAELKRQANLMYDGVELSQDALQARQRLDRVFQVPAAELSGETYDLILSFHVLEHILDPLAELRAWSRLLADGGRLLIEVPHGAGHPLLVEDLNAEHLHQFTPASLTLLLARAGFSCDTLSLGHYESPVYPDCMRVTAQITPDDEQRRTRLLQRFEDQLGGPFLAYGIGGDFLNYVNPLAEWLDIRALLDTAPGRWGQRVGRHTICAYAPERHATLPVLVCSIRFAADIRQYLLDVGIADTRIVGLEDIYAIS